MITVQMHGIHSAEVGGGTGGPFVTLRFGNRDRAVLHVRTETDARALAAILNGAALPDASHAHAGVPARDAGTAEASI